MKNNLEKQLAVANKEKAAAEKKIASLKTKIEAKEQKSKKKEIHEEVKTLTQVYKKLKVNPKKDIIKIDGFDKEDVKVLQNLVSRMRVCKVYNEGKIPTRKDRRHYPWHYLKSAGAGLVFNGSDYDDGGRAGTGSASRLSFLSREKSDAYAKNFMNVEEGIIGL